MSVFTAGRFGAADAFNTLLYGQQHPSTIEYLASQAAKGFETLTEAGRAFMDRGREIFDHYYGMAAQQFARQVISEASGTYQGQYILALMDVERLQQASLTMQRWVMAMPEVRSRYHDQMCSGYAGSYVDMEPGMVGEAHYDWRRVMDGVMVVSEDDWRVTQYVEPLKEGDRDLLHGEQVDILRTWDALGILMALGQEDPTSATGDYL